MHTIMIHPPYSDTEIQHIEKVSCYTLGTRAGSLNITLFFDTLEEMELYAKSIVTAIEAERAAGEMPAERVS